MIRTARRTLPATALLLALAVSLVFASSSQAAPADGKKVFATKGCIACHSVGGPSVGPGPELTQVAYQRDAAWLTAWLADPQKVKPGTVMPKLPLTPEESEAVIAYLLSAKRAIPAADSTNGEKLFADYTCNSCHRIHGKGGKPQFPDLGDEAKTRDAAWLERWLENPAAVKKGTFMATFPLTPSQRHALVTYVLSLATKK
jgi:nitric oxide reductase subunit C